MRRPIAQPLTVDGAQLCVDNVERIRQLLGVLSADDVSALVTSSIAALGSVATLPGADSQVYEDRAPLPPDNSNIAAVDFPATGGALKEWSVALKQWISVSSSASGVVPVGAIVAWHKSLTGVPALSTDFVECNGQTLADADSPLDGQVIPELNSTNLFLRGDSTSGTVAGITDHLHDLDLSANSVLVEAGVADTAVPAPSLYTTESADHIPPHMTVVWIMRVK